MLERRVTETYIELADTLVLGFDVIDFLHMLAERCVEILDMDAAGILLADPRGALSLVAASSEQARLLELFQLQHDEGPCLDAFPHGRDDRLRGPVRRTAALAPVISQHPNVAALTTPPAVP